MTRGEFDATTPTSYLYVQGEDVYDIWTTDADIAARAIAALPAPGASVAPRASATPAASTQPVPSPAPSQ